MLRAPSFWWERPGFLSTLLAPAGWLYGAIAGRRMRQKGQSAGVPVICVGNFTLGGSGKTPAVIALAQWLTAMGETPFVLTRGYGGRQAGPLRVDPAQHRARDVGDEPLLLARHAPVIVARDRVAGAAIARAQGARVILMDDGLQNPSLKKHLALAVVDGRRGLGNARVFPAGPLRAPLPVQLAHVHAVLVVGAGAGTDEVAAIARSRNLPLLRGRLEPDAEAIAALGGARVLAFAGIGDPDKFFATLDGAGIAVAAREGFADHHRYGEADAQRLLARADKEQLLPVTTEKDMARLAGGAGSLALLQQRAKALPVRLVLEEEDGLRALMRRTLGRR